MENPPFEDVFRIKIVVSHCYVCLPEGNTVDGRNPAPVGMVNIPLSIDRFIHPRLVGNGISEPSTVVAGFFGVKLP